LRNESLFIEISHEIYTPYCSQYNTPVLHPTLHPTLFHTLHFTLFCTLLHTLHTTLNHILFWSTFHKSRIFDLLFTKVDFDLLFLKVEKLNLLLSHSNSIVKTLKRDWIYEYYILQ